MPAIDYSLRRSERARRVRVTVDPARGVEVVVPAGTFRRGGAAAEREAAAAVAELRPWIERRLADVERHRELLAARGDAVPLLGESLRLVAEPGRTRVRRRGGELLVPASEGQNLALERWYRRHARQEIAPRLDRACAQAGLAYTRLTIRGDRWLELDVTPVELDG